MLIISKRFYPGNKSGGPQTSLYTFCNFIVNQGFKKPNVLTLDRDVGDSETYHFLKKNKVQQYDFSFSNVYYIPEKNKYQIVFQLIKQISNEKVIIVNSFFDPIFGAILPVFISLFTKKEIYCFVRGELQANSLKIKKNKKSIYLYLFGSFLSKRIKFIFSDINEYKDTTKAINFKIKNFRFVANLPQIPKLIDDMLPNDKYLKLIYVGRIDVDKNLLFLIKILIKQKRNIILDIFGPIRNYNYWQKCLDLIAISDDNLSINYKGILERSGISGKSSEYHFLINPSFSENYGHSIAEALACGLPVIVSVGTPWQNLENNHLGFTLTNNFENWKNLIKEINISNYNNIYSRKKVSNNFFHLSIVESAKEQNNKLLLEICKK